MTDCGLDEHLGAGAHFTEAVVVFCIRRGTDSPGRRSHGGESVQMCGVGGASAY